MQVEAVVPPNPGEHRHNVSNVVPEFTLAEPVGHVVHTTGVLPVSVLYVPGRHKTQGPAFAPTAPALQMQSVLRVLRSGEVEYAGHNRLTWAPEPIL
jgi:hypothetical protein